MVLRFTEAQKRKKIFVLNSTGFIGFAVTKRLVESGFRNIYSLYRNEKKRSEMFQGMDVSMVTFLRGEVAQADILKKGIENADIVINASGAATDWGIKRKIWEVNVEAPKAMVEMIEEMGARTHYIQIISAGVYGLDDRIKTEAGPLVACDRFYTASKVEIHSWFRGEIKKGRRFPITVLAPSIVWGPGDQIYIPTLKQRLRKKQLFYLSENKELDFIHIDDLVDGILRCLFNERAYNQEYILSGPEPFTFNKYIGKIAEFSELPPPTFTIPVRLALVIGFIMECIARCINLFFPDYRPLITRFQVYVLSRPIKLNIAKAKSELGYNPTITFARGADDKLREYIRRCAQIGLDARK